MESEQLQGQESIEEDPSLGYKMTVKSSFNSLNFYVIVTC